MNAAAPQIWSVFCQIHRAEPLHHSVVGPLGDLSWCDVVLDTTEEHKDVREEREKAEKSERAGPPRDTSSDGRRLRQFGA